MLIYLICLTSHFLGNSLFYIIILHFILYVLVVLQHQIWNVVSRVVYWLQLVPPTSFLVLLFFIWIVNASLMESLEFLIGIIFLLLRSLSFAKFYIMNIFFFKFILTFLIDVIVIEILIRIRFLFRCIVVNDTYELDC